MSALNNPDMDLYFESGEMSKWDKRFCELAQFVSGWSKDPSAKVGAVLYCKRGGDIAVGYNGLPMEVDDSLERLNNKDKKLEMVVHAELNALLAAGSRATGSTLYVWGKPICSQCAGSIIQTGVYRVVAEAPKIVSDSKWDRLGRLAKQMFDEAGIITDFYHVGKPEREEAK